jgi:hypothetical protein
MPKRQNTLRSHELYETWHNIRQRCENPKARAYRWYGGRGIKLYWPWKDSRAFIDGIEALLGPRPAGCTLDRIDNDGDYKPGNLRWATQSMQVTKNGRADLPPATPDWRKAMRAEVRSRRSVTSHALYTTWHMMRQRCLNPNAYGYANWGGRGIRVHEPWHDARTFIREIEALLGPRPDGCTLDRIDTQGHYEPGNVRWATFKQQMSTRRGTIQVKLDGELMSLRTACMERLGLTRGEYFGFITCLREGFAFDFAVDRYQIEPSRLRLVFLPDVNNVK